MRPYNDLSEVEVQTLPEDYICATKTHIRILFTFRNVTVSLATGDTLHIRTDQGADHVALVEGYVSLWGHILPRIIWLTGESPLYETLWSVHEDYFGLNDCVRIKNDEELIKVVRYEVERGIVFEQPARLVSFNKMDIW
jgi:hypothetical protein